jgi:hypothetical protein
MREGWWVVGAAWVMALAVSTATAGDGQPPRVQPRPAIVTLERPFPQTGTIAGMARDAADRPLPGVRLQLRDLRTGHMLRSAVADLDGTFSFLPVVPGTYVVELTLDDGSIAAVSEAATVGAGETVRVVVRLSARSRSFAWWFGAATATALAQAASLGVLAVDPGQPVSPQ